jgi:hypothetical protein
MNTKKALTLAMVLLAGADAGLLLTPARIRLSQPELSVKGEDLEDPFADMIQEGDGLLAQHKAEAAEAMRKRSKA